MRRCHQLTIAYPPLTLDGSRNASTLVCVDTIGSRRTPAQRELQARLDKASAELRARVLAMPAGHKVLPPDLSWAEYADMVEQ